jgi:hypothetical protein
MCGQSLDLKCNKIGLNSIRGVMLGWPEQNYECVALPAELPRRADGTAS